MCWICGNKEVSVADSLSLSFFLSLSLDNTTTYTCLWRSCGNFVALDASLDLLCSPPSHVMSSFATPSGSFVSVSYSNAITSAKGNQLLTNFRQATQHTRQTSQNAHFVVIVVVCFVFLFSVCETKKLSKTLLKHILYSICTHDKPAKMRILLLLLLLLLSVLYFCFQFAKPKSSAKHF